LLPFLRHDDIASCRDDFEHYRREGFPVYSLKRDEKRQELLDLLVAEHAGIIDTQGRIKQTMHGLALAWHYHPLAWTVRCGNRKTPVELFSDDLLFLRAIERRTKLGNAFTDSGLRKILRSFSSTQSVSNFRPTAPSATAPRIVNTSLPVGVLVSTCSQRETNWMSRALNVSNALHKWDTDREKRSNRQQTTTSNRRA
jgi:hypothetical protein